MPYAPNDVIDTDMYHAAVGSRPWREVLARLAESLGAQSCRLVGVDSGSGAVLFSHGSEDISAQAQVRAARMRSTLGVDARLARLPTGTEGVWHFDDGPPAQDSRPTSGSGTTYRARHPGSGHAASAMLLHRDGEAMWVTLRFDLGPRGFSTRHRTGLTAVTSPLVQAAAVYHETRRLVSRALAGVGVLNTLSRPALVASAGRFVSFKNEAARLYLDKAKTLFIGPDGLAAHDRKTDVELAASFGAMTAELTAGSLPGRRILRVADRTGGRAAALSITALPRTHGTHGFDVRPLMLLVVHELNHPARPDTQMWVAAFDFTRAQVRVAQQVFRGADVAAIAASLNIASTTVKSHLKELYWKTGTRRQAHLVLVLAALQHP